MAKRSKRGGTVVNVTPGSVRNEFNPDYSYIRRDLRRIFTLAGFFFAVLIVLSFVLK